MIATAIDVVLALVALEACGLVAVKRLTGRGLAPRAALTTLAAGFFLLLATRLALAGVGAGAVALCLLLSLVAHVADLSGRWSD